MNHKRRRPKNRRAGCLMCKPHKANGQKGRVASLPISARRRIDGALHPLAGGHRGPRGAESET